MGSQNECVYVSCTTIYLSFLFTVIFNRPLTDISQLKNWLLDIKWTPKLAVEWQQFYNDASRIVALSTETQTYEILPKIPEYEDLKQEQCIRGMFDVNSSSLMMLDCNSAPVHKTFILFSVFPFLITLFLAA